MSKGSVLFVLLALITVKRCLLCVFEYNTKFSITEHFIAVAYSRATKNSDRENRRPSAVDKSSKVRPQKKAPQIPYLTASEFESVPK